MPSTYTNVEYADMVFLYGFCNGSSNAARLEYSRRFPNRRLPNKTVFSSTFQRLRETGSFAIIPRADGIYSPLQNEERSATILQYFDENPSGSVRRAGTELNVTPTTVWRSLVADGRHPYHYQRVQNLLPQDLRPRRFFSDWYLNQVDQNPHFSGRILWTDEATFTRKGIINQKNSHLWLYENPHAIRQHHFQHEFQCNVWLGLIDNILIGPHFLPPRLNADTFLEFLDNDYYDLVEDIPLHLRRNMWFQLDGCPAHYGRGPRQWLNDNYPNQWIGRAGPVAWPARSPDLTPLDFFVWGDIKQKVYARPVNDLISLRRRIIESCGTITDIQCRSATAAVGRRCQACLNSQGNHFEHLI